MSLRAWRDDTIFFRSLFLLDIESSEVSYGGRWGMLFVGRGARIGIDRLGVLPSILYFFRIPLLLNRIF